MDRFLGLRNRLFGEQRRIVVIDDVHLVSDPKIFRFAERAFEGSPERTSFIMISRCTNPFISNLISKGRAYSINESELKFTAAELGQYFRDENIALPRDTLDEMIKDTDGWAFAVNLIVNFYDKVPGYRGYMQSAVRANIFRLMEAEFFALISKELQRFLACLSLIDHRSIDLVALLADGDGRLIDEMERQNVYIRRDDYINTYQIHKMFLDFLCGKQHLLTESEKRRTYEITGSWCDLNGFKTDALSYYEKIQNYAGIMNILYEFPMPMPADIAKHADGIFARAPAEVFDRVELFAVMHVRVMMCLGEWGKALELLKCYEKKYLELPDGDAFSRHNLACLYYCWGMLRSLMCTGEDRYDFCDYYARHDDCLIKVKLPANICPMLDHPVGPWVNLAGASRQGAPQEYIDALVCSLRHASQCRGDAISGLAVLAMGELNFYRCEHAAAEALIVKALGLARESGQFEVAHRAMFYMLRLAVYHGDHARAEQVLKAMEAQLDEPLYANRFITYDIAAGWYYCAFCMPGMVPDWLKKDFAPYKHAAFIENFGNQIKVRYCYLTRSYTLLLVYMEQQKKRESVLYGRVEMLAMQACVYYRTKNKTEALKVLAEACEAAIPNGILMPFIELGKDMRTLATCALNQGGCGIPGPWLESICQKASSYAKQQAHVISAYKQANRADGRVGLTPRETEILEDLSHGLSRSEIAANRGLSVNTVKMVINILYDKMGAESLADLIRISVQLGII